MKTPGENHFCYIPIRQRDVQWGLYVTGAGHASIMPDEEYPPQAHPELYDFNWKNGRTLPEYQIICISRGKGVFESAPTGCVDVLPGTILLLFPGVWHRYRPQQETGWDEWWVSFNGEAMDRLVEQRFFSPDRAVLSIGSQDAILAAYDALWERLQTEQIEFPHRIAADVMDILAIVSGTAKSEPAELISQGTQNVVTVKDRIVAETIRLIWQQSHQPMTIAGLARQLPITRRSLERRFLAAMGRGIHDEIIRCRLERAKRLLTATNLSLKEAAEAAGFSSSDNMGRAFRRVEGITPSDYRTRQQTP